MDDRLKKIIAWTTYIIAITVIILTIGALIVNMLAPTLFPNVDISGIKRYIDTLCVILSFLSAALGGYSIWQANTSGKQAANILKSIEHIESNTNMTKELVKNLNKKDTTQTYNMNKKSGWNPDTNKI